MHASFAYLGIYSLLCLPIVSYVCLTSRLSAFFNQLSSMHLYYAYLTQLLYLASLLCLLLSSVPTRSPTPVSTCTESICLVILPGVLPSLLPTVPSAVFMYSTYIIVSYAYLVCYDYIPLMHTHAVSIAYLVSYSLLYYAYPVSSAYLVFYTYSQSAVPTCTESICLLILYSVLSSLQYLLSQ